MSKPLKTNRLKSYLLLSGLIGIGAATQLMAADTLCSNEETVEFNCSFGKKLISVCASNDLATDKGYLQYRFGRNGALEIQLPEAQTPPGTLVKSGTLSGPGGNGAYLRFSNEAFNYVVYASKGKKAGVVVEKGDKLISHVKCRGPAQTAIGAKLFAKAGLPADEQTFKLP